MLLFISNLLSSFLEVYEGSGPFLFKKLGRALGRTSYFPVSTAPAIGLRSAVYLAHPSLCYWSLAQLAWYHRFSVCFFTLLLFSFLLCSWFLLLLQVFLIGLGHCSSDFFQLVLLRIPIIGSVQIFFAFMRCLISYFSCFQDFFIELL